ncbi:MAG TPA: HD domain-containing protein, partial [Candidatus Wirthbacteria bacterium]|nr:HD domain-containing protein [Candidatus Wirthbacteria bacterium]
MGEAISGDIGYHVKRFAGELLDKVEEQTFGMLVEKLDIQAELTDLYHEYKELESPESKIVKCADALDAYTQMLLTPGANLRSQQSFVDEKSKELSGDLVLGNFVSDFFNQAILLLKKREVHFIGE